jgi:CheY-like chemotaxis protein
MAGIIASLGRCGNGKAGIFGREPAPLNAFALTKHTAEGKPFCFEDERRPHLSAVREGRLTIATSSSDILSLPRESVPPRNAPGVLVVDDDELLRNLMSIVLQRRGFTVWTAASGAEAVTAYQQFGRQIAVVLLDVRMPVQDGPETLVQLRLLNPALRCCFMSGHTGAYTLDDLLACGASQCFEKPFQLEEVAGELMRLAQAS